MLSHAVTHRGLSVPTLLLAIMACADVTRPNDDHNKLREAVEALGFRPDMIVDRGSFVLVEGDIAISKDRLLNREAAQGPVPRLQWTTDLLNGRAAYTYVNLALLGSVPEWATATRQAMAEWSALPAQEIRYQEGNPGPWVARITVRTYSEPCPVDPLQACTLAFASWPTGNDPGPTIDINLGFNRGNGPGGQPTAGAKLNTMVHELGHTNGFRHTNWIARNEGIDRGANLVPGTDSTDAASVMNGGTANNEWAGFSFFDRVAARVRYRGVGPTSLTGSIDQGHPRITWAAMTEAQTYNLYFFSVVCDGGTDPETGLPNCWESSPTFVGSTASTSYTDLARSAITVQQCDPYSAATRYYRISAVFPGSGETKRGGIVCFLIT